MEITVKLVMSEYTTRVTEYPPKNSPIKKLTENLNRSISKEDVQMTFRCKESCSTSLMIREMQITTTMRYHLTPVRMTVIKKTRSSKC